MGIPLSPDCHPRLAKDHAYGIFASPRGSNVGSYDRQSLEGKPNISPSPETSEVSVMNVTPIVRVR